MLETSMVQFQCSVTVETDRKIGVTLGTEYGAEGEIAAMYRAGLETVDAIMAGYT